MKTQASNLLLFTCIMMLFTNICITVAAYKKPEIQTREWILDEKTNTTECPRCHTVWFFTDTEGRVHYCPSCAMPLKGVRIEE